MSAQSITAMLGVLLVVLGSKHLPAQRFESTGTLTYTNTFKDGRVLQAGSIAFRVVVDAPRWFIRIEYPKPKDPAQPSLEYSETGCDGRDVFHIAHSRTIPGAARRSTDKNETGFVCEGSFPEPDSLFGKTLWLAFASSSYFEEHGVGVMPSILPFAPTNLVHIRTKITPDGTGPSRFELLLPGYRQLSSRPATGTPGEPVMRMYPPPYDTGYVAAVFTILQTTNVGGVSVPLDFVFDHFIVDTGFKTNSRLHLADHLVGRVATAGAPVESVPFPEIRTDAWVHDGRFTNLLGKVLSYECTNRQWLSRHEPLLADKAKQIDKDEKRHITRLDQGTAFTRRLFLMVLVAVALLPPIFLLSRKWERGQVSRNQEKSPLTKKEHQQ